MGTLRLTGEKAAQYQLTELEGDSKSGPFPEGSQASYLASLKTRETTYGLYT